MNRNVSHSNLLLALVALAILLPASLLAQNTWFLRNSAASNLDEADMKILTATLQDAMSNGADGDTVRWENPDNEHFGTITVLDTHEDYETTCRSVRMSSEASGKKGSGVLRMCLADDEQWRFAPNRRKE